MQPTVGRVVHYVSFGTPGGEYTSQCRAAIVTEVPDDTPDGREWVCLAVLNPSGMLFNRAPYDEWDGADIVPGAEPQGGTWHWPERVE